MQEILQKFPTICIIRNTDALCDDTMAAQAALQPILKENKTLNIKTERIMYNGTIVFLCKGFSWLLTMSSTSSMADDLRSLGHLDVDWKQHID